MPYWLYPGEAAIERHVLVLPLSRMVREPATGHLALGLGERCLIYVASTRARKSVLVTPAQEPQGNPARVNPRCLIMCLSNFVEAVPRPLDLTHRSLFFLASLLSLSARSVDGSVEKPVDQILKKK